jgi:hypothetical protein
MIIHQFNSKDEYLNYLSANGISFAHEAVLVYYITKKGNIKVVKSILFRQGKYSKMEFMKLFHSTLLEINESKIEKTNEQK